MRADPTADQRLDELAEAYFEEILALDPELASSIGDRRYDDRFTPAFEPGVRARAQAIDVRYRGLLEAVERERLDADHRLTYDVLVDRVVQGIAARRFRADLLPLDQANSFTSAFVAMGSGTGTHRFERVRDYEAFLARARGFEAAVDTAIANLRLGAELGIVLPRVVVERFLTQLDAHIVDDFRKSSFYGPIESMPASFSADERALLSGAYGGAIRDGIVPSFRKLRLYLRTEYLQHARESVGWSALPEGSAWYAQLVRDQTTSDLIPEQLHRLGLSEVARIQGEMRRVQEEIGFTGTLAEFFDHARTEPGLAGTSGDQVQVQVPLEPERTDRPRVRRFGLPTPYLESWGLFAETLAPAPDVRRDPYDPYARYGVLHGELWRALRLVLDTGIHAEGWTREQATDYARANSSMGEPAIVQEVERFIAMPGQALTYEVGQMKIRELRERAETALGDRFDVNALHRAILEDGALPLSVLEAKIDRWIEAQRRAG